MFCTECGTKNEDNAKFCFNCGKALTINKTKSENAPTFTPEIKTEPLTQTLANKPNTKPTNKEKKKTDTFSIVIWALFILGSCFVLLSFFIATTPLLCLSVASYIVSLIFTIIKKVLNKIESK